MIEVIYKDEKQEARGSEGIFSVPKNIRQIGQIRDGFRIYMEDYVYTFLTKASGGEKEQGEERNTLAVLTGETKWEAGITYIFVKGAILGEPKELSPEHIEFTDLLWQQIHEEAEKYFQGQEIVGWFFGGRSLLMEAGEVFCRVHLTHFGGEKILMLMDPAEREEAFFRYENNFLVKQSGYYLYYEKNPMMQTYMLEKNAEFEKDRKEEVPDEAVKAFRKIIQKKKNVEEKETEAAEERPSVFSYAATACLAVAVIAAGVRFYQNYQAIQRVQEKTEAVSSSAVGEENIEKSVLEDARKTNKGIEAMPKEEAEKIIKKEEKIEEHIEKQKELVEGTGEQSREREKEEDLAGNISGKSEKSEEDKEDVETSKSAESLSQEEQAIYKEESDLRKAERRVRASQEKEGQNMENRNRQNSGSLETAAGNGTSYIIKPGDTLYQISVEKYGSMDAVAEICRMNGISAEEIIYPGQIIVLP